MSTRVYTLQNTDPGQYFDVIRFALRKIKQVETKVDQLMDNVEEMKEAVKENKQEMNKVSDRVKKVEEQVGKLAEDSTDQVFEELREREARRLNLVFYGLQECAQEGATGRARQDWDIELCINICKALDLDYERDTFKFCRRVGPTGEGPHPLVVGFFTEMEKSMIVRRSKRLKDSEYRDVSVANDLTKRQRKEEKNLWAEVECRNNGRTADQIQKNLAWMVVGARGERRVVLQPSRPGLSSHRGRGRGGTRTGMIPVTRAGQLTGGNAQPLTNSGQGLRRTAARVRRPEGGEEEEELPQMEEGEQEEDEEETAAPLMARGPTKRKAALAPEGQPLDKC